jgi:hypothetical protein
MLFSFVGEEFSTSTFIEVGRKKIKTYNDHCTISASWNLALGLLGTLERERERESFSNAELVLPHIPSG